MIPQPSGAMGNLFQLVHGEGTGCAHRQTGDFIPGNVSSIIILEVLPAVTGWCKQSQTLDQSTKYIQKLYNKMLVCVFVSGWFVYK